MASSPGYSQVLVKVRVQQEQAKPLLGKASIKYGQCFALSGYFLQQACMLGARHRSSVDEFGHAYLGLHGESGAMQRFLDDAYQDIGSRVHHPMTFSELVQEEECQRVGFTGDPSTLILEAGMEKLELSKAMELVWQYAQWGAVLGLMAPEDGRRIYEHTHRPVPPDEWARAKAAGLNIPAQQDILTWDDVCADENEGFIAYCKEFFPSYALTLSAD